MTKQDASMTKQAVIRVRVAGPPVGRRPRIAIGPADHFGISPEEHDRIADLVGKASLTQAQLSEPLVKMALAQELRVPFVATLERFLAATRDVDAGTVSDDELAALWRDAERETP
jgi:hypothetical protein